MTLIYAHFPNHNFSWTEPSTAPFWPYNRVVFVSSYPDPSPMEQIADDLRLALAKAKAPIAILIAAIRDALRCMPRPGAMLPGSQCSSRTHHRPRRRDVRHGEALLNVHRMPA